MIIAYQIKRGARFRLIAIGTQDNEKSISPTLTFNRKRSVVPQANGRNSCEFWTIVPMPAHQEMKKNRSHFAKRFLNSEPKKGYAFFGSMMKATS